MSSAGKDGADGAITTLPPSTGWTAAVSSWASGVAGGASSWASGVGTGVAGWWADRRRASSGSSDEDEDDDDGSAGGRRRTGRRSPSSSSSSKRRRRRHPDDLDVVDADDVIVPIDLTLEAIAEEVKDAWRLKEVRAEDLMRRAVERSEKPWLILLTALSATSAVLLAAVMWKLHLLGGGGVPPTPGGG